MKSRTMAGLALVVALVIPLAGCAGKARLTAAKMCAAAGGTYSPQTQSCNTPAQSNRMAAEMCQAHGGYYDSAAQVCEIGRE